MRSEQGSDCSNLYLMKISSLDPKNILLRDQRVVKMHLFFTRKMMVGSNFLLVIHIPQGMEVSKSTIVFSILPGALFDASGSITSCPAFLKILLIEETDGIEAGSQTLCANNCSRISQANIPGLSVFIRIILFTTEGVATC